MTTETSRMFWKEAFTFRGAATLRVLPSVFSFGDHRLPHLPGVAHLARHEHRGRPPRGRRRPAGPAARAPDQRGLRALVGGPQALGRDRQPVAEPRDHRAGLRPRRPEVARGRSSAGRPRSGTSRGPASAASATSRRSSRLLGREEAGRVLAARHMPNHVDPDDRRPPERRPRAQRDGPVRASTRPTANAPR